MTNPNEFMFATIADFLKARPQSKEIADKLNELPESTSVILHTFRPETHSNIITNAKCWHKGDVLLEIEIE